MATVPYGTAWSRWKSPEERKVCVPFRGSAWALAPEEYWVYVCEEARLGGRARYVFYLLGEDEEPTLERVSWSMGPSPGGSTTDASSYRRVVDDSLRGRFGGPTASPRYGWGWPEARCHLTPFAVLRTNGHPEDAVIEDSTTIVQGISTRLAAAIAGGDVGLDGDYSYTPDRAEADSTKSGVAAALRVRWPAFAVALADTLHRIDQLPVLTDALKRVNHGDVSAAEHDLVVFAAHVWFDSFWRGEWAPDDSLTTGRVAREMGAFGVALRGTYDNSRCPEDSVLVGGLLERAGQNPWADRIFLEFMERGWQPHCSLCGWTTWIGSDQFRPVIDRGETFLREHRGSAIWYNVALLVAEAHETVWSLSKAGEPRFGGEEVEIDPSSYQAGAADHRRRAMELYQRLIREDRATAVDPSVKRRMRRLALDVDTNFHRFWCVWD